MRRQQDRRSGRVGRRCAVLGAAIALAAAVAGCGSSDPSVRSDARGGKAKADPTVHVAQAAGGLQTVEYQGVAFDVPGDWPVHDLATDPTMCVRLDVHAVYLGSPSPDMNCPAGRVGTTEAVLVEPIPGDAPDLAAQGGEVSAMDAHGLSARVSNQVASMGQLQADIGTVRASITVGPAGDALAQQILQSFRAAGQ